jgi:hypothetical protein
MTCLTILVGKGRAHLDDICVDEMIILKVGREDVN